jgi:hypothetical protein
MGLIGPTGPAGETGPAGPPLALETIMITGTSELPEGVFCVTCPTTHPFMLGGACEREVGVSDPFGPSTTIDVDEYCCQDVTSFNNVTVTAVCGQVQPTTTP